MKKAFRILLPFIITAVALWWAFGEFLVDCAAKNATFGGILAGVFGLVADGQSCDALVASFSEAKVFPAVFPFLFCFAAHFFFRSLRWRYLLPAQPGERKVSLQQLFDSMMLGNLATFIFPFRLGEFIRPLILSRWTNYTFSSAFVSVVIERFFDLATVLLSFAFIIASRQVSPQVMAGATALAVMSAGLLVFLVLACLAPDFTKRCVVACSRLLPAKLAGMVDHFTGDLIRGASVVKTPSRLLVILLLTVIVWSFAWLQFYAMLYVFPWDQGWEQSLELSVALGVLVALAIAAPSAPGFFGTFQVGCKAAFQLFGYGAWAFVSAYSIVMHLVTYVLFVSIGFLLLRKHDLKLFDLKKAASEAPQTA
jgi:uncharacterized protein (TIRG00374 family)